MKKVSKGKGALKAQGLRKKDRGHKSGGATSSYGMGTGPSARNSPKGKSAASKPGFLASGKKEKRPVAFG